MPYRGWYRSGRKSGEVEDLTLLRIGCAFECVGEVIYVVLKGRLPILFNITIRVSKMQMEDIKEKLADGGQASQVEPYRTTKVCLITLSSVKLDERHD